MKFAKVEDFEFSKNNVGQVRWLNNLRRVLNFVSIDSIDYYKLVTDSTMKCILLKNMVFSLNMYCNLQQINTQWLKVITTILFLIPITTTSLSFNHTTFTPNDPDIIYDGSARFDNNHIQLTPYIPLRVGRVTCAQLLHLWDRNSGNLTDFTTNFTFVVNSFNSTAYGDGFTFFLAPNSSRYEASATGGSLGLTSLPWDSPDIHHVAVEFDIFSSPDVDPPYKHVGIDINALSSVANVSWLSDRSIMQGLTQEASISYDSQSGNLSVMFTGFTNTTLITQRLSYRVNLRDFLPEFVTFGFTAATGGEGSAAVQEIHSWSFSSNLGETDSRTNETDSRTVTNNSSGNSNTGLMIGLLVGCFVLVLAAGLVLYILWKKRKQKTKQFGSTFDAIGNEFDQDGGPKKFFYNDLKEATNNFAEQDKLGEGGFGSVYKGFIEGIGSFVAVKRISSRSKQGVREFDSEVQIISTLRHRNLVRLLGWCREQEELLLVYELMPNNSLDLHLYKSKSLLTWGIRFRIAQGLASALNYLHEEWEQCVVHRDIKSSNIMLDANYNARLGDFGLARLIDHEKGWETTLAAGTLGYMAPEYVILGKASKETDMFSFGVVLLEIACGRKSIQHKPNGSVDSLVEWVWNLYATDNLLEAADARLRLDFDVQEMKRLLGVGLMCTQRDRNLRPSIRQAICVLNAEAPVPQLTVPIDLFSSYETSVSITS